MLKVVQSRLKKASDPEKPVNDIEQDQAACYTASIPGALNPHVEWPRALRPNRLLRK